jgi:hypothetical protein
MTDKSLKEIQLGKVNEALVQHVQAEKEYNEFVSHFCVAIPIIIGKSSKPNRVLDKKALDEIQKLDDNREKAHKVFRGNLDLYFNLREQ